MGGAPLAPNTMLHAPFFRNYDFHVKVKENKTKIEKSHAKGARMERGQYFPYV